MLRTALLLSILFGVALPAFAQTLATTSLAAEADVLAYGISGYETRIDAGRAAYVREWMALALEEAQEINPPRCSSPRFSATWPRRSAGGQVPTASPAKSLRSR